ncbi:glycosyltransferase [Wukongibacter sp. M2B1]|uniref:glycosyltransferase n=1 Tax=Wukongibacter sp. M2B1 TaxID=3088895 RepID=UPI003D79C789
MKIGIFTDIYYPLLGGVTSSILTLEEELVRRGHDVTIVTIKVPGHVDSKKDNIIRIPSVKFMDIQVGYYINPSIVKELGEMDFDVIHTHTEFFVGMVGAKIAKKKNIPLIHTCHTIYDVYVNTILSDYHIEGIVSHMVSYLAKNHTKKCEAVIVPSHKTKDAIDSFDINEKISVIPSGIHIDKFFNSEVESKEVELIKDKMGLGDDDRVILSLSRVTKEKRVDVIIRQFHKIWKEAPNTKLVIVGDGQEKKKMEELCRELKIDGYVSFTGEIPWEKIELYYRIADVFVSASKVETQGLTIVEAMASGVPVVTFNDKNIIEVIEDGISGRLFSNDNELAGIIDEILNCDEKKNIIIDNAYKAVKMLSAEKYAERIERLYEEIYAKYPSIKRKTRIKEHLRINSEVS